MQRGRVSLHVGGGGERERASERASEGGGERESVCVRERGLAISLTIVFSVLKYGVANLQSLRCLFSRLQNLGKKSGKKLLVIFFV